MDQLYSFVLSLVVLGYFGSSTHLMGYLRRVHFATWVGLGQPEFTVDRDNPSQLWKTYLSLYDSYSAIATSSSVTLD
jgi:hypothetical protein